MKKTNNTNIKISLALNILIVIMTVVALTIVLSGFKFMKGYETHGELQDYKHLVILLFNLIYLWQWYHLLLQLKKYNF